jgi:ABC-type branched-subunit amino acid transport system ATPase component
MTSLAVADCTVSFGGLKAINDLTLSIPSGTITALIGPNGSGKSTFCNMVSGQIPPKVGTILLDGVSIRGLRPDQIVAAGLARTYQVPRVPKELTIGEVIGNCRARCRVQKMWRGSAGSIFRSTCRAPTCPFRICAGSRSPARWPASRASCCSTKPWRA